MCDEKPPYEIASQPYIDETSSAIAVWAASIWFVSESSDSKAYFD